MSTPPSGQFAPPGRHAADAPALRVPAAPGVVEHIHVAPEGGMAMRPLAEARLVPGRGIVGDRYYLGTGTYSKKQGPDRELTLIAAEVIEEIAAEHRIRLSPGEHRRNITVRGLHLNPLVGRRIRIGEAVVEVVRLNEPCRYLERVTGKALYMPLLKRSGLNCRVLEGGTVRLGDPVIPL